MGEFQQASKKILKKREVAEARLLEYNLRNKIRAIRSHAHRLLGDLSYTEPQLLFVAHHIGWINAIPQSGLIQDLTPAEIENLLFRLGQEVFQGGVESFGGSYAQFATRNR